jgi:hypothetical protein
VAKKDDTAQDLKVADQSNDATEKEDDRKPAAVTKKMDDATLKIKDPPKCVDEEGQIDNKKPAAKENVQDKKKRRNPKLPLHPNSTRLLQKSVGKSPNMDMDLKDTESESGVKIWEDTLKPWKLITTLKEREIRNLKQAANEKEGPGWGGVPDEAGLELLRAAKSKDGIIQEQQEKAYNAELKRLEQATARKNMPVHQRDIERCFDILPRGARPNVLNRVKDEMSTIWPITAKTEFADREATELFKIRYTPLNPSRGMDRAQYHALQMTTKPGEEEGTRIKKTMHLERLNPIWMGQRFDPKFLRMVQAASSRAGFYMKWIYVPAGDARQDEKPPSDLVAKFPVHYTQKNHDTCLFKSVASALQHLNKKQIAYVVSSMAKKYMYTPVDEQLNKLGSIAQENDCDLLVTK